MISKTKLLNVWFQAKQYPGLLRIFAKNKFYSPEEIEILDQIDEEAIAYTREAEKDFYENAFDERKEQEEFEKEVEQDIGEGELREIKLDGVKRELHSLDYRIQEIHDYYEDSIVRDNPRFLREAVLDLNKSDDVERKIKKLRIEKYFLENPNASKGKNWIGQKEIAHALSFPFDSLIKFNSAGFALCPMHEEKTPSLHLFKKTNTIHCFGCKYSADTIKYLRDKNKLSFTEAVRILCK